MNGFSQQTKVPSFSKGQTGPKKKMQSSLNQGQFGGDYQVFSSQSEQTGGVIADPQAMKLQQRKQSATYSTSFLRNIKPSILLSEGSESSACTFNSHRKSSNILQYTQSTKSSSRQMVQLFPEQSERAQPQTNNFYFPASKKNNICKRTLFSTSDKAAWENQRKQSNIGLVSNPAEQHQKTTSSQGQQIIISSRSQESHLIEKNKPSSSLSTGVNSPFTSQKAYNAASPLAIFHSNENQIGQIGTQQQQAYLFSSEQTNEAKLFSEIKRLQILANQQRLKIETLERTNLQQKELIKQKDIIIFNLEEQQSIPSLMRQNQEATFQGDSTHQNEGKDCNNWKILSQESSFIGKDKNIQNEKSAQMPQQKSGSSSHQSILTQTTTASNASMNKKKLHISKNQKSMPFTTTEFLLNSPKHKEKLLSLNLQEAEVKDFILKTHKNQHIQQNCQKKQQLLQEVTPDNKQLHNEEGSEMYKLPNYQIAESLKIIFERTKRLLENKKQIIQLKNNYDIA